MNRFVQAFLVSAVVHAGLLMVSTSMELVAPTASVESGVTSIQMSFQTTSKQPPQEQPEETEPIEKDQPDEPEETETDQPKEKETPPEEPAESPEKEVPEKTSPPEPAEPTPEPKEQPTEQDQPMPDSLESSGAKFVENVEYRSNPPPKYPPRARALGLEGRVKLLVEIDREGDPASVSVFESSGSYMLDDAALEAVRDWEFVPAKEDSQPVLSRTIVPVKFNLK